MTPTLIRHLAWLATCAALTVVVSACSCELQIESDQDQLHTLCTRFAPGHLPLEVLQILVTNPASIEAVGTLNGAAKLPVPPGFETDIAQFNQAVDDLAHAHLAAGRQDVVNAYRPRGDTFTEHLNSACVSIWASR